MSIYRKDSLTDEQKTKLKNRAIALGVKLDKLAVNQNSKDPGGGGTHVLEIIYKAAYCKNRGLPVSNAYRMLPGGIILKEILNERNRQG